MANVNFIFNTQLNAGFQLTGVLAFEADITLSEQHARDASITEHPVEDGSVIADHVIINPERVTLNGFVSDSELIFLGNSQGRTQSAFDSLDTLWRNRQPITIVTSRKIYQNMIITRLQLPYNAPDSMRFSVDLKSIKIVESTVEFVERARTQNVKDQAQAQQNRGQQIKKTPNENAQAKSQSLLKKAGDSAWRWVK